MVFSTGFFQMVPAPKHTPPNAAVGRPALRYGAAAAAAGAVAGARRRRRPAPAARATRGVVVAETIIATAVTS